MKAWQIVLIIVLGVAIWYYEQNGSLPTPSDVIDEFTDDNSNSDDGGSVSNTPTVVSIWASAIQKVEGYFPGSRSYRDDNPGNLEETGTAGNDGPYAIFSSFSEGLDALYGDLEAKINKYPNATLLDIMNRYAPAADGNDPTSYAATVAKQLTAALDTLVTPSTTMAQLKSLGGM